MDQSKLFGELRRLFEQFPGIGPRQASRFIWALLDFPAEDQKKFAEIIAAIPQFLKRCAVCFRIFPVSNEEHICSFCGNGKRDKSKIMVLERDNDLINIEKTGYYRGLYHVLGEVLDPLDENKTVRERIKALYERVSSTLAIFSRLTPNGSLPDGKAGDASQKSHVLSLEVILALSPTKLGEFTSEYIKKILEPYAKTITITRLGRGLSTGIELEYADDLTLRQALDTRK